MAEGTQAKTNPGGPTPEDEANSQVVVDGSDDKDVLEEDDDFEEFEDEPCDENDKGSDEDLQWEDNWDDEAEGEDNFTKRLREELAQEG